MFTTAGTDHKPRLGALFALAVLVGFLAVVPVRWRPVVRRIWSYAVYYLGYRLLTIQVSCGSLAVSGVPLALKLI